MKKVIFIEPKIIDGQKIEEFFKKNNPDSSFVNPHICLVFPFKSNKTKEEVETILLESLFDVDKFEIELSGFSVSYEEKENFLFLNVTDENNILKNISKRLYEKLNDEAVLKGNYTPHITIGKSASIDSINQMRKDINTLEGVKFKGVLDKVYCKVLEQNDDGSILLKEEVEVNLGK